MISYNEESTQLIRATLGLGLGVFRRGGYFGVSRVSRVKLHKVISKDKNALRKSKSEKCSIVVHSFCFELNLHMLNRSCSSNYVFDVPRLSIHQEVFTLH